MRCPIIYHMNVIEFLSSKPTCAVLCLQFVIQRKRTLRTCRRTSNKTIYLDEEGQDGQDEYLEVGRSILGV